jgi:hypothetical protein
MNPSLVKISKMSKNIRYDDTHQSQESHNFSMNSRLTLKKVVKKAALQPTAIDFSSKINRNAFRSVTHQIL